MKQFIFLLWSQQPNACYQRMHQTV